MLGGYIWGRSDFRHDNLTKARASPDALLVLARVKLVMIPQDIALSIVFLRAIATSCIMAEVEEEQLRTLLVASIA